MSKKALSLIASGALLFSAGAQAASAKAQAAEACDCCPQCHCVNYDITVGGGYVDQHSLTEDRLVVIENNNSQVKLVSKNHDKHGTGELIFGMHSCIGNNLYALMDFGYRYLGEDSRKWELETTPASIDNPSTFEPLNIHDKYTWNGYIFRVGFMYDFLCSFYAKALVGAGAVVTKHRIEDHDGGFAQDAYGTDYAVVVEHHTDFVPALAFALGWNLNCHWGLELSYEHLFGGRVDDPGRTNVIIGTNGEEDFSNTTFHRERHVPRFNLLNLAVNYKY